MTRWVTEATPVSSVVKRDIGLASAPWVVAAVAASEAAEAVDVVAVVEVSVEFATTAMNLVTSLVSAHKVAVEVEEEALAVDVEEEEVAEAAVVASVTTARNLAIWPAIAPMSVSSAKDVVAASAAVVVAAAALAAVEVVAEAVVVVEIVSVTSAMATVTSRGTASLANREGAPSFSWTF